MNLDRIPDFSVPPRELVLQSQTARRVAGTDAEPADPVLTALVRAAEAKTLDDARSAAREALELMGRAA